MLRDAPRPDHGSDCARREHPGAAQGAAVQYGEHGGPADEREDHKR